MAHRQRIEACRFSRRMTGCRTDYEGEMRPRSLFPFECTEASHFDGGCALDSGVVC